MTDQAWGIVCVLCLLALIFGFVALIRGPNVNHWEKLPADNGVPCFMHVTQNRHVFSSYGPENRVVFCAQPTDPRD